uniref:MYB binding protein 1a n=1 Tax=Rousettus aegyptiacus TaxID=9407 RepID=A0A7J8GCL2_ROUAE|nr:MYB binding protein 1a [Rousettus aegyptiacus]
MAEMDGQDVSEPMSLGEGTKSSVRPADRHGLLKHSREFLDFFWDIAKPQQETRLEATEKLLEYLRTRPKGSEMKYALKRLITGLGVGRETARPCYSLALAQLLQSFEDIPLCSILQQIQEKHDLQKVKKAMMRPALFANLFGVLALFQSGRLVKDSEALMKSVKLLQALAQHYNHLQEQPQKALVDILSEVPEATLQEVLPKVLKADLNSVLGSPEHLELFLLAQQKVPAKLEKLMGSVNLFSDENIPRLVTVLKMAATSVKKERKLPAVALDLLRLALQEDKFPRFWKEVVEQGLLKKQFWPASYLCFRLLGAALPLLSKEQLQLVMRGDVIRHYGEHMVTAKFPNQFKFAPEMNEYVGTFLEGCRDDPERQLAVVVAFTSVTNQGLPVVPTFWRVVRFLSAPALRGYVAWLRDMFLQPDLDSLVTKQPENPLVLELLDPLLNIIRRSMRTSSTKQEQDLLHKTARIFTHHLCRSRHYCHDVGNCVETLYTQVERLVQQASHQADSSISLYYFNASLYLLRVLKGNTADRSICKTQKKEKAGTDSSTKPKGPKVAQATSCLDLSLVTPVYSSALSSFLTKRNSPLTIPMFLSLFSRHPVLCKSLLPIVVQHVTGQARPRHQAQACLLLQKTLPIRELRLCFEDPEWEQLVGQILAKVTENLRALGEAQTKSEHLKERSSLELLNALFRIINHEKLTVDLTCIQSVLQSQQPNLQQRVQQGEHSTGSSRLYDLYWQAMKILGVQRPKSEKKDAKEVPSATQNPISMKRKKKGFLPETKKRKKRKSEGTTQEENAKPTSISGDQPPSTGKKKRKRMKAKVAAQGQVNGTPAAKSLAIKSPALKPPAANPSSTPAETPKPQKKNRKLSQVNGATLVSTTEPAGEKQHQKELPKKGVSGKSPHLALPQKKARLSLASKSPSLLQTGAKKKKAQIRKEKKS